MRSPIWGNVIPRAAARIGSGDEIRVPHSKVLGTIDASGTRLTELARRANAVPSAMAELVDDLESHGYLERTPDPADGRAKLIRLTDRGWEGVRAARAVIEEIEAEYARVVGQERFEAACAVLQELRDANSDPRSAAPSQ